MDGLPSFWKRQKHISAKVEEVIEEISMFENLLGELKSHAQHMILNLQQVSSPDIFCQIFIAANSSLFTYMHLLTNINCKLEITLVEEIKKWNDVCWIGNSCIKQFMSQLSCNENHSDLSKSTVKKCMTVKTPHEGPDECYFNLSLKPLEKIDVERSPEYSSTCQIKEVQVPEMFIKDALVVGVQKEDGSTVKSYTQERVGGLNTELDLDIAGCNVVEDNKSVNASDSPSEQNMHSSDGVLLQGHECGTVKTKILEHVTSDCEKPKSLTVPSEIKKTISINEITITKLPGSKYQGCVEYAVSPSELYVYFATNEILLMENCDKDLESLHEYYKLSHITYHNMDHMPIGSRKEVAMRELGTYAVLHSEAENVFQRVKIMNWAPETNNDLVNVFLLDFGKTLNVHLDKLYPMLDHLTNYPAFATRCHLSSDRGESTVNWNKEVLDFLKDWVSSNEEVTIVINDEVTKEDSKSLSVTIYNKAETECLNNLISKFETGVPKQDTASDGLSETPSEEVKTDLHVEKWNPMEEAFESPMNSYDTDIDDPAAAIYGYVGQDYDTVCKFYGETGKCFKGESCRKNHIELDPKGFTTDKEEVYVSAFNSLKMPNAGDELHACISSIISVTEFYCVLDEDRVNKKDETLSSLTFYMNQKRNISQMKKLAIPPSIGQIVIAKYSGDGSWYRARVVDVIPEKDLCALFYVDYGNTETVSFTCIRAVQPQYLHLPFQAIRCTIDGVCNKPGLPFDEVNESVYEVLSEKVKMKIISTFPGEIIHLIVKLYNSKGQDIGEQLVRKNIAMRKDNLVLSQSEVLLPG